MPKQAGNHLAADSFSLSFEPENGHFHDNGIQAEDFLREIKLVLSLFTGDNPICFVLCAPCACVSSSSERNNLM